MTSTTAVQISHRIDPAQIKKRRWRRPRQPRQDDERQQPDGRERGAGAREPDDHRGRQDGGRNRDRRNRQQSDARSVKAGDGERALRQPRGDGGKQRGRGQTGTGHVECWSFYRQTQESYRQIKRLSNPRERAANRIWDPRNEWMTDRLPTHRPSSR